MIIKSLVLGAVALTTALAPMAADAQNWRGRGDRDRDGRYERWERRADQNRYDGGRYTNRERYNDYRRGVRDQYRDNYRGYNGGYAYNYGPRYQPYYGGGYYQPRRWYRGAVLPYEYRRPWYINDYGYYGYSRPPRGYGYYRTDSGDIVLAALATGVILSVIAGR